MPPVTSLPPDPEFGAALPVEASPDVLHFLALRRSTPAVTLAAPAPDSAQLADLFRIAARAPDHGKLAPWRFVVLEGDGKAAFITALEGVAQAKGDATLVAKLAKLKAPPMAVAVISSPKTSSIPEWEQLLSAGAVCVNLLYASLAMGFGANWLTDWYSYDADATTVLGLTTGERVAGFMMIGTPREAPLERERPAIAPLVTHWKR